MIYFEAMSFRSITNEEYEKYAPELKGSLKVVSDGEKYWYFKSARNTPDEFNRDKLGYILGSLVANVTEVRGITLEEYNELKTLIGPVDEFNPLKHYLVRIAGSYKLEELKWQTLEEAVASEIVFSTWIRRRDTHVDNRGYVDGIPIFFDCGISFLPQHEQYMGHISVFSRRNSDWGQPNRWRVKTKEGKTTTQEARSVDRHTQGANHFVNDLDKFKQDLDKMVQLLQTTFNRDLAGEIKSAGFDQEQAIFLSEFLSVNLYGLPKDLEIMAKIFN